MRLFEEGWFRDRREANNIEISYIGHLIEQDLSEGLRLNADKEPEYDFETDQPGDILKLAEETVYSIGDGLYAGFVFSSQTEEMQDSDLQTLAKKINRLGRVCDEANKKYPELDYKYNKEIRYSLCADYIRGSSAYKHLLKDIPELNDVLELPVRQSVNSPDGGSSIRGGVFLYGYKAIEHLIRYFESHAPADNFSVGQLRAAIKGAGKSVIARSSKADLSSQYATVKKEIIKSLNSNDLAELQRLVDEAALRLALYINEGNLGFNPTIIVSPISSSSRSKARSVINYLGSQLQDHLQIPYMQGLMKARKNVVYNHNGEEVQLTDNEGYPVDLEDSVSGVFVGKFTTLSQVAEKIANGSFKITSIFEKNRGNFSSYFDISDELQSIIETDDPKILLIDDCIYSGSTQREMIDQLERLGVTDIAGYGIIKT